MKLEGEQNLLRVYLRSTDRHGWTQAADALVERARRQGLAGATVLRGIYGLDVRGGILAGAGWGLAERVPMIVEFVDNSRAIGSFLDDVREVVKEGLASVERAHVLVYRGNRPAAERAAARMNLPGRVPRFSTLPSAEEFPAMKRSEDGELLRIFTGEEDTWQGQPLYRAIVLKAKELGLAGATVLQGPMGFGANSRVHTSDLLDLSEDLPIVIEIVDSPDKIQSLLPFLDKAVTEGLITLEGVRVLRYGPDEG